jgi:hypothetical protein
MLCVQADMPLHCLYLQCFFALDCLLQGEGGPAAARGHPR